MFKVSRRENCDRYYIFSLFGFALFVHYIHNDEEKDIYHNHPWSGISFIFGEYLEQRLNEGLKKHSWFHWLPAKTHHRLELPNGPVWTLFFHFRRSNRWTVVNESEKILVTEPWRAIGGTTSYKPEAEET